MITKIAVVLTILSASPAWPAGVSFFDGNNLHNWCSYDKTNIMHGVCSGYIIGVADSLSNGPVSGFNACIPEGPVIV